MRDETDSVYQHNKEQELTGLLGAIESEGDFSDGDDDDIHDDEKATKATVRLLKRRIRDIHRQWCLGTFVGVMLLVVLSFSILMLYHSSAPSDGQDGKTNNRSPASVKIFYDEYPTTTTKIEIRDTDEEISGYRLPSEIVQLTDLTHLNLDYNTHRDWSSTKINTFGIARKSI